MASHTKYQPINDEALVAPLRVKRLYWTYTHKHPQALPKRHGGADGNPRVAYTSTPAKSTRAPYTQAYIAHVRGPWRLEPHWNRCLPSRRATRSPIEDSQACGRCGDTSSLGENTSSLTWSRAERERLVQILHVINCCIGNPREDVMSQGNRFLLWHRDTAQSRGIRQKIHTS